MKKNELMVSVFVLTYNHSKYLEQALDSIIEQEVNFSYEIVIADDCSTDDTQEIIKEYQKRYPNLIRPILRKKNIGATKNSLYGLKECKGKYIALLEGDDYWCDREKLQIQVDFLESHQEYIACAHKNQIIDYKGSLVSNNMFEKNYKEIYTFNDMKKYGHGFHTASLLYRNIYKKTNKKMDNLFLNTTVGDIVLMYILLDMSNIYVFDRYMSVWRCILDQNNWSSVAKRKPLLIAYNGYKNHLLINDYFKNKRNFGMKKYDYISSFYIVALRNNIIKNRVIVKSFFKFIGIKRFLISLIYFPIYVLKKITINLWRR